MAAPFYTSNDLIASVKRKIALPIHQVTFSDDDILAFANEEMFISQVPSVLQFHEDYFVYQVGVLMESGKNRYPIPNRAIGLKLRDLFWADGQTGVSAPWGNYFEMTRINPDDKAYFQRNVGANQAIHKFYIEGNDVILTPANIFNPQGYLVFSFYIRPNQLVKNERAATISSFRKTVTVASVVAGDKLTIDSTEFEAVSSSPSGNQFLVDVSDNVTASNLANAINSSGIINSATVATNVITLDYDIVSTEITASNPTISVQTSQGINFSSIPSHFANKMLIDFLQTNPGHKIYSFDIKIPNNGISGTVINFNSSDVPTDLVIGDYVCSANEAIIPQLPPDLHNALAERTSARILASLGDQQGLAAANQKIAEIEQRQGNLLDDRVDGSPKKVLNRYSLLRLNKQRIIRRY